MILLILRPYTARTSETRESGDMEADLFYPQQRRYAYASILLINHYAIFGLPKCLAQQNQSSI